VKGIHLLVLDFIFKKRKQRRTHGLFLQGLPIEVSKERMTFDSVPPAGSKTCPWLEFKQAIDEALEFFTEVRVIPISFFFTFHHILDKSLRVVDRVGAEREAKVGKLISKNTQSPEIHIATAFVS
jgi:hypothetical protein